MIMKYIFVKFRRDFIKMLPQFLAVFFMSMLSVTIFSGMEGVWNGMKIVGDNYYKDTNLSSAIIYSNGVDDTELDDISKLTKVESAERGMRITMDINKGEKSDLQILTLPENSNTMLLLCRGEAFNNNFGIWLDENYANAHKIEIGDKINSDFMGKTLEIRVLGIVLHSEYVYFTGSPTATMPNSLLHGYGFISEKYAKELLGTLHFSEIRLWVDENADLNTLESDIKSILGDRFVVFKAQSDYISVAQLDMEIGTIRKMATLFSAVFVLLSLLTMYTTMSRLVLSQRTQIGTLKAIGYSNWIIRLHYALYGVSIPIIGGLLGILCGKVFVSKALINIKKTSLTLPAWEIRVSWLSYALILAIALICVFAAIFAANHNLGGLPSETMREENKNIRKAFKNSTKRTKLPFSLNWVLRDIARNKTRFIISVIGIAGSMMLMTAGFGIMDSISFSNNYVYETQYKYEYKASLKDSLNTENMFQNSQLIQESPMSVTKENISLNGVLTILNEGEFIILESNQGKKIDIQRTGAIITKKYAEEMNVQVGDTINLEVSGITNTLSIKISEITSALTPQGIYLSKSQWKEYGNNFYPTAVLFDNEDYKLIKNNEHLKDITSLSKQKADMDELLKSVNTIVILLITASILLSVIILYNLGMLNFVERHREYATMKVMGYRRVEIREVILYDWLSSALPGYMLGIPIGFGFLKLYIKIVSFDSYEWLVHLEPFHFVLASVLVIGCSLCVSLFISQKADKIIMTEALKSVE